VTGVAAGNSIISYVLGTGCYARDTVSVISCITSINGIAAKELEIRMYPNPVKGELTIEISSENEVATTITDLLGRNIKTVRATPIGGQVRVNVDDIVPGNYVVRIEGKRNVYRNKMTVTAR
jgi:hypothetical protein